MRDEDRSLLENAFRRAANFIIKGESEEDHLANHHAMACLATWKSYEVLGDSNLKEGYEKWKNIPEYLMEISAVAGKGIQKLIREISNKLEEI